MAIPETQLEIASAHSQAHLQLLTNFKIISGVRELRFAQANPQSKNCKRASNANAD